jgi:hypothetical protein
MKGGLWYRVLCDELLRHTGEGGGAEGSMSLQHTVSPVKADTAGGSMHVPSTSVAVYWI